MTSVSEFLKTGLKQSERVLRSNLNQRADDLKKYRKDRRQTLVLRQRNLINVNLSPISSPATNRGSKPRNNDVDDDKQKQQKHRIEMLMKWKEQKQKRMEQQKAKSKPIFKVQHVSAKENDNLDKIYKVIKGKPITNTKGVAVSNCLYRLAPSSTYKFKPPPNIKPIHVITTHLAAQSKTKKKLEFNEVNPSNRDNDAPLASRTRSRTKNLKQTVPAPLSAKKTRVAKVSDSKAATKNKKAQQKLLEEDTGKSKWVQEMMDSLPSCSNEECLSVNNSSSKIVITPHKIEKENHIYISPFVTISRGKEKARKEYHWRRSNTNSSSPSHDNNDYPSSISPEAAVTHFRKVLKEQADRLQCLCNHWISYKDLQKPAEEAGDMINVAVGQTELLLKKKFEHFKELIQQSEMKDLERPITTLDLHGFWETVLLQINNVDKRFDNLSSLRENDWEEVLLPDKPIVKARVKGKAVKKPSATASQGLRAAIIEARKKKMQELKENQGTTRHSRWNSGLSPRSKTPKRSPGLFMIKATRSAKSLGKNKTPSRSANQEPGSAPRSILKSRNSKVVRKSKIVLFKDSDAEEDVDNVDVSNLITFTPGTPGTTPRRSLRLQRRSLSAV